MEKEQVSSRPVPKRPHLTKVNHSPFVQNLILSATLFCNPGLYLAIATLGAGGGRPSSIQMANISNALLYAAFVLAGVIAPTVLSKLGPRYTIIIAIWIPYLYR
ncbi:uncharacterized protein A1O5_02953 [Cladophialophora psammophila CBS 110553]|uniref:Uncharacterized protein n=1 Tax=Cladophialophora psammophila CBS 110553 TaxID=1182543 RepID=W9WZ02_9EURO|nr:uncharacterized protein A1O5_02953 [Cladophialophora psammophila CBS 110553]EXJ73193.1 hypothetical protein A1O5_02953 [Cladophialophora psammophila CBS 110553]